MKLRIAFVLLITLVLAYVVSAQEPNEAGRLSENLRTELSNAKDRVAELKIRLEQLDYDLKPENIERYFNAVGSTRPEELRESRRRQLQTERDRVSAQLDELASRCTRLETAIYSAQAMAYQQNALLQTNRTRSGSFPTFARVLIVIVALCALLGGIAVGLLIRRRRNAI
jgi:chromosome segregation ATPase